VAARPARRAARGRAVDDESARRREGARPIRRKTSDPFARVPDRDQARPVTVTAAAEIPPRASPLSGDTVVDNRHGASRPEGGTLVSLSHIDPVTG